MTSRKEKIQERVIENQEKYLAESGGEEWFDIEKLVLDDSIYPRRNILATKVNAYSDAMKLGQIFPAIAVEKRDGVVTGRILDGWHRYHALLKQGAKKVSVQYHECMNDIVAVRKSYILNNSHGLSYSAIEVQDYVKTASDLGMDIDIIADDINKPVKKVENMIKNFGTAKDGSTVSLKRGLRHLKDTGVITKKQEALNKSWIGTSATVYSSLLFKYLDAGAYKTDDTKFIKSMDKLTTKWLEVRKNF
jgi:hypothetical protein